MNTFWIAPIAIRFFLTALTQTKHLNWDDLTNEIEAHVDRLVPSWLEATLNTAVVDIVSCIKEALNDQGDLKKITDDLVAQDWNKALTDLDRMVRCILHPQSGVVTRALVSCRL